MTHPALDVDDPEAARARQPETYDAPGGVAPRSRRPRRSVVLGLAVILMVAAIGSGLWLRRGSDDLGPTHPRMGYVLHPMSPGKTSFVLGSLYFRDLYLRHPGKDVQILEVTALTSPNIEYLGAFTIWPRDYPTERYSVGPGFPGRVFKTRHPIGALIPAAEIAFIPTLKWSQPTPPFLTVAVGFRVTSGDVGAVNGVRVVYKVGGKTRHEDFPQAVIACVKPNLCKAPKNGGGLSYTDIVLNRFGLVPLE